MVGALTRLIVLAILIIGSPATAMPVRSGHMSAELVPASDRVAPGAAVDLGVVQKPDPGWHTYWTNPGDTGLAADIQVKLPEHVTMDAFLWPAPQRLDYDGVVTYGYDHSATAIARLHVPQDMNPGTHLAVSAHVESLVCRDTCEPVSFDLKTTLKVVAAGPAGLDRLADARLALPALPPIRATWLLSNGIVRMGFSAPDDPALATLFRHPRGVYVYGEDEDLLSPDARQMVTSGTNGFSVAAAAGSSAPADKPHSVVLSMADGRAFRVLLEPGDLPEGTFARDTVGISPPASAGPWFVLMLAFAGGIILNLMPCVFPILSMKLLTLTRAGHDHSLARREALVYGAGAMATFLGLSLSLEIARGLGAALGWGFQLQSPLVTAALSLLMLLVGLNLSGAFELGGTIQASAGATRLSGNPYLTAFLTGVLAVVVAAPCSAPFMATAMGVALVRGGWESIAIFVALGAGFAAPFVGLTFLLTRMPSLARWLPRPGRWMERLRQILAWPMYLAAVWMAWVFWQQAGGLALSLLLAGIALATLAVVLTCLGKALRVSAAIIALALCVTASLQQAPSLPFRPTNFSAQQIAVLRAEDKPVFVDMTAAWCVTCKVNEKLALSDARVQAALKASRTIYMVGDWTRRDPEISIYLSQFGRSGVPLYVYYGPGHASPVILPQILTPDSVLRALSPPK